MVPKEGRRVHGSPPFPLIWVLLCVFNVVPTTRRLLSSSCWWRQRPWRSLSPPPPLPFPLPPSPSPPRQTGWRTWYVCVCVGGSVSVCVGLSLDPPGSFSLLLFPPSPCAANVYLIRIPPPRRTPSRVALSFCLSVFLSVCLSVFLSFVMGTRAACPVLFLPLWSVPSLLPPLPFVHPLCRSVCFFVSQPPFASLNVSLVSAVVLT